MKKQDSVFTLQQRDIWLPRGTKKFEIVPFGDIHYRAPDCDEELFHEFLNECKELDTPQTYYLCMGDETDMASTSEREIFDHPKLHESTLSELDKIAVARNEALYKKIEFMKGRMIGMVQGNHYWVFSGAEEGLAIGPGMSSTKWLCNRMECPWLGFLSYIKLRVHFGAEHTIQGNKHVSYDLVVCHGKAGGKLVGTSINQVDDLRRIFPNADCFIFGHDHHRGAWPVTHMEVTNNIKTGDLMLKSKEQFLARSGAFLRGYSPGNQNYVTKRMYKPSSLGAIRFIITKKRTRRGGGETISLRTQCLE